MQQIMLKAHLAWSISRAKDEVYKLQKYQVTLLACSGFFLLVDIKYDLTFKIKFIRIVFE